MKLWLVALLSILLSARADEIIYTDNALNSDWQDWSWSTTTNYDATDIMEGESSMSVNSQAWAALSLKYASSTIEGFAGLKFDIAGDNPPIQIYFQSSADGDSSTSIPLTAFGANITADAFTTLLINFSNLPPGNGVSLANDTWDRINFQALGDGAVYHLDNIVLLTEIFTAPEILSAEPFGNNVIAVTTAGGANVSDIKVTLNNKRIPVVNVTTMVPVDTPSNSINYLTLGSHFAPGNLSISTDNGTFTYVLPPTLLGIVNPFISHPISDLIYGVNFPVSASYITNLGITLSRWGGNAVTAYNPFGGFTNAGNDWYFENRVIDNGQADDWLGWVQGAGSKSYLTIPALDWVSKDSTSYSYSAAIYPDQSGFDPYKPDAGSGLFPNGSYITPVPDPNTAYTPWNTSLAAQWLTGLVNKPAFVTIDNELEIASGTHQDMHPIPVDYDEEVSRIIATGTMAKKALPGVTVAAPSMCGWWYYWRSQVGYSDAVAHNNTDFLPYFLEQLHKHDKATGKRLLDTLDLHWYFQADTSANDAAAKALRLRMTRALWDTTYVDESWIATSTENNNQPNSSIVQLIPRIHKLIDELYPGTKFSLSEFSSTDDTDLTGGLVVVDMLGIFGRFQLDAATYWATPDELGPVGLAYWLFRGYGRFFGSSSAAVDIPKLNPDTLGVYASTNGGRQFTLVVVNKDPDSPVALTLAGVPAGKYFLRHFGGQAGVAKFQTTITVGLGSYLTVPAYTAVFIQQL